MSIFRSRRRRRQTTDATNTTPESAACPHVAALPRPPKQPSTDGCAECLADGETWLHLRLCLTCGHVGCCDSSPHRHATAHHGQTGHPVMRSIEPGEDWRWCFVDDMIV